MDGTKGLTSTQLQYGPLGLFPCKLDLRQGVFLIDESDHPATGRVDRLQVYRSRDCIAEGRMRELPSEIVQCTGNGPRRRRCDANPPDQLPTGPAASTDGPQPATDRTAELLTRLGIALTGDSEEHLRRLNRADTWQCVASAGVSAVGNLAVVAPYFNPAGYQPLAKNLRVFCKLLESVPLYPAEVSFGSPWITDGLHIAGGERNVLWQKERLINLAVSSLPAKFDRVAWLDADIVLTNPDWYGAVESALDVYPVVQIGDTIVADGRIHNMAAAHGFGKWAKLGYAWAARREIFPLYDGAVIGGGDMLCAYGWLGRKVDALTPGRRWFAHYAAWARRASQDVQGKVGFVPGTLVHLDHGGLVGRQYNERYRLLAGLDPEADLEIEPNGLWAWTNTRAAKRFCTALTAYFASRQDG